MVRDLDLSLAELPQERLHGLTEPQSQRLGPLELGVVPQRQPPLGAALTRRELHLAGVGGAAVDAHAGSAILHRDG